MGQLLHSWVAPPAAVNIEIRACLAPPNPHRWVFMWAVVETFPDGRTEILTGTGKHGNGGCATMGDALACAERAFEQISAKRGAA